CRLIIANRTPERAHTLAQAFGARVETMNHETLSRVLPIVSGIVNCTSLGMTPDIETTPPIDWDATSDSAWVCDLVYRPLRTRLLQQAQARGLRTVDGLGMLIHQGALAFERWTEQPAPVAVMREAAEAQLE
ncbi:MAG: hypothetical protein NZM28_09485, partial [Fimbriimonadales bacterium]|nr:hypothetical protein [Fimbriimonadales bacterium]